MADKQLTVKVKLNTKDAENKLKNLNKLFHNLDRATNKVGNNNQLEKQLQRTAKQADQIKGKVRTWANQQKQVTSATRSTNTVLSSIRSKLKSIAATYLGIMGLRGAINTTDNIIGTQNKLNNINGGDINVTQQQMDKMYTSANRVRMAYSDMMANASKSMILAGDAFGGNMDNAIRFQEIMAETYALGGASAQEMHTSMYQMIQALGSGILAGDELRSVREGAPLAYKAIEQFAQGVYNTTDSLKEMASQGLITSDIIVAAIMKAGDDIDAQFENTYMTFGQAWNRIKNAAVKAFEPVSNMLRDMLNRAADNGAFEKIETAFWNVSKVLQIVFRLIEIGVRWIADNWNWLKHILIGGLLLYASYLLIVTALSIKLAWERIKLWLMEYGIIMLRIALLLIGVYLLIQVFNAWKNGTINTCQAIVSALFVVGAVIAIIALLTLNWIWVIVGLAIAAIGAIINWLDYFLAAVYSVASVVLNIFVTMATAIIKGAALPLAMAWDAFANLFGNLFNDPIAAIIHCFESLADSVLSILYTIACGIDAIFGSNLASAVQGWRDGLSSKADALAKKYGNGSYSEKSKVTEAINVVLDSAQSNAMWNTSAAWNKGMSNGAKGRSEIAGWGSKFQTGGGNKLSLDSIGAMLGLNFGEGFPKGGGLNTTDVDDLLGNVADTADNTGSMAKSMELTAEDLAYLRKVAEMEWKKEYTTASITVDMSNYNNINGETDLDGIVTKLADKLYEEMNIVANGVYA